MESGRENVAKIEHQQRIQGIEGHTDQERPLLSSAREMPEEHEHPSNKAVDDQIKRETSLADLMRKDIDQFGNTKSENEMYPGAAQGQDRVDDR